MNSIRNRIGLIGSIVAVLLASVLSPALAQEFPSKPIRMIVEYPAGTGGDGFLRVLATHMSKDLGQQVIIDNRPGAGGLLAAEAVARSVPDGYTVLAASQSPLIIRPFVAKGQGLDVFRDLMPVTKVYNATTLILAHKSFPGNNLADLIAYARANPGKVFYGTSGLGTSHHFTGEALQQMTGIEMKHVPYKGGTGSMQAVTAGEVPIAIGFGGSAIGAIKSGNVRVLALVEGERFMNMSNIQVVSQVVRGFEAPPSWTGLFVAPNTPPALVRRINAAVVKSLSAADFPVFDGIDALGNSPEQFAAELRSQFNLIGKLAKTANIQPQ